MSPIQRKRWGHLIRHPACLCGAGTYAIELVMHLSSSLRLLMEYHFFTIFFKYKRTSRCMSTLNFSDISFLYDVKPAVEKQSLEKRVADQQDPSAVRRQEIEKLRKSAQVQDKVY